jgi:hypothetical protein
LGVTVKINLPYKEEGKKKKKLLHVEPFWAFIWRTGVNHGRVHSLGGRNEENNGINALTDDPVERCPAAPSHGEWSRFPCAAAHWSVLP